MDASRRARQHSNIDPARTKINPTPPPALPAGFPPELFAQLLRRTPDAQALFRAGLKGLDVPPAPPRARAWRDGHEAEITRELVAFLAMPNVASDAVNIRRNAETLRAML